MMKRANPYLLSLLLALPLLVRGQAPERMSFQSVVRDAMGALVENRPVGMRISILQDGPNGAVAYAETHQVATNVHGLASLQIGEGSPQYGQFTAIDWSEGPYFLRIEADPAGGTAYGITGISELLSVPYALYAHTAERLTRPLVLQGAGTVTVTGQYPDFTIYGAPGTPSFQAGQGIDITGATISNTAPDVPITLTGAGSTLVTGTYPDFVITSMGGITPYTAGAGIDVTGTTISNTAPDVPITLTGEGGTTVTGSYPNFTIGSAAGGGNYQAGPGIALANDTIVNTAPDLPVELKGENGILVTGNYPSFTVSQALPQKHYVGEFFGGGIVFYVWDDGSHGLIASLQDLTSAVGWHTGPVSNTSASSFYDGATNTQQIVSIQGAGNYAARLCADFAGGGFTDWYLPGMWELDLLHQNAFVVSHKLSNDGDPASTPLMATASYWSSTQFDASLAYMIYFPEGVTYLDFKNVPYRVRAIRQF
jgi:hypothetical protein